jgi:uncharacterized protein YdbL (DUF1318 family)
MSRRLVDRTILAFFAVSLAACVPVTVNVSFPQAKLDAAAREIEEKPAQPAGSPPPASSRGSGEQNVTVDATPRTNSRSPAVVKATESRRQRRPPLREWKARGCIGETNEGFLVERPGDGCGQEAADLIRDENADRRIIYDAFIKENNIPASDTPRVQNAFAKARQERARTNDWIQLENGQWVRKS